jgi:hypothetical protein
MTLTIVKNPNAGISTLNIHELVLGENSALSVFFRGGVR